MLISERIRLHFDFKIKVTKDDKGEVYLAGVHGQTRSKFEILGNLGFAATNIFLGDEDVSKYSLFYYHHHQQHCLY